MPLVAYSDSESEAEQDALPLAKRAKRSADCRSPPESLPPLPQAFLDLYATNARQSRHDDPALHGGRKRAIPHMDGHWPSHVYLECKLRPLRAENVAMTSGHYLWLFLQPGQSRVNHISPAN